jgi:hypothetical protein
MQNACVGQAFNLLIEAREDRVALYLKSDNIAAMQD